MKKVLNKIAIWLYIKTRDNEIKSPMEILNGITLLKSNYIPKDTCYIGIGEYECLKQSLLDKEICLEKTT